MEYRELDQIHGAIREMSGRVDTLIQISASQEPRLQAVESDTKQLQVDVSTLRGRLDNYRGGLAVISLVVLTMLPVVGSRFLG